MKAAALKALVAVLLVGGLLAGAIAAWDHYIGGVRKAADEQGYGRRDAEQKTADNKALREALADVQRLKGELQGISDDAKKQKAAAAVAVAGAADVGVRLRAAEARLRAAVGQRSCPGAVAADGGPPTDAALDLFADVRRRLDEAQDRVTGFADESRIAGLACERAYDALK